MTYADLTGDGHNDVISCDRYGPGMTDLWESWDAKIKNGGRIQWLKNPDDRTQVQSWTSHHIGNSTGMHRRPVISRTQPTSKYLGFPLYRPPTISPRRPW
ncbi:hypothetical protein DFH08DRAFT_441069 [Mycena albidolilacea]|uniref:Aldos-2-ulose dehydratase beta-propeller domain-containing protein n=1 Tax=Mycena albidolilacea TaxID=1033008 RepID=A0AAD7AGV9_9AGAR|nr:hypothetical protein DFH08DRAFT_441069 [Mycena albidolilacea]